MSDPMKGQIASNHPQAPRSGVLPDGKKMGRDTAGSQVPKYDGPNRKGTFDGSCDCEERSEVSYGG